MKTKIEQFPANNPNPVLSVKNDGTVLYSNAAGEHLLHEWDMGIGEKLPSCIGDIVLRVISLNIPERMEVTVGKRVFAVAFHPLPEDERVNIYGFDISDYKNIDVRLREAHEQIQVQSKELQVSIEELRVQSDELNEANVLLHDSITGFRTLAENSPDLIARFDRQGHCLYANPAVIEFYDIPPLIQFYGLSINDFINKPNFEVRIDPEMMKLSEKQCKNIFTTGKPEAMVFHYLSPKGKKYYFDTKIVPEFANNEVVSVLVISRDITVIKEVEAKLKETLGNSEEKVKERTAELEEAYKLSLENEKRFNEAQKIAHIGSWDRDIVTGKLYWSDETYRIYGRSLQQFGATYDAFLSYVHPDDRDYVDNAVKEAINGKPYKIDHRIISANGEERIVAHTQGGAILMKKISLLD
jgi:PAS domain S-box-containing protein